MSDLLALASVSLRLDGGIVLDDLTFELGPGEALGIAGPSGSGKTTLLRLLLGLIAPSRGTIRIEGKVASEAGQIRIPPHERGLSMVFQDLALWPHLSVARHLDFVLEDRVPSRAERESRVCAMLDRVGLGKLRDRLPPTLSGGEQQRVALARALVVAPKLVLFDEPLASLDVELKAEICALIAELVAERETAIVYVAHDPSEIASLVSRLVVLERGRIVQCGSFDELCEAPASEFVRRFVSSRA